MAEAIIIVSFISLLLLGAVFVVLSYFEYRTADLDELKRFLKLKLISICIFVIGILVHTVGDLSNFEMGLETVGHFIIMVGAIILIKEALVLTNIAEEYGYCLFINFSYTNI